MGIFTLVRTEGLALDEHGPEETFTNALSAALDGGGLKFTWLDAWTLDLALYGSVVQTNVREVLRSWRLAPSPRRGEIVQRWVEATTQYPDWQALRAKVAQWYESAADHLLMRLQPAGHHPDRRPLVRPFAPGIDAAIFLDVDRPANGLAYTESCLTRQEIKGWQVGDED